MVLGTVVALSVKLSLNLLVIVCTLYNEVKELVKLLDYSILLPRDVQELGEYKLNKCIFNQ